MKDYLVCLEFRVTIKDLAKAKKEAESAVLREETIAVFQRRLATVELAKESKK